MVNSLKSWKNLNSDGTSMFRILFNQLLDDKTFKERRRITIGEVSDASGVSRGTITRIVQNNIEYKIHMFYQYHIK